MPVANYLVSVGSARQVNKGVCAASLLAGIQDWLWSVTLLIGHHQMWECEEGRASNREFYGLKFQLVWRQPGNHLLTMWEFGQSGLVGGVCGQESTNGRLAVRYANHSTYSLHQDQTFQICLFAVQALSPSIWLLICRGEVKSHKSSS